ncbi:hypothetical protein LTR56_014388 [Elasticomyces elasticus]|nr:hypothetical protein LTR22_023904 [Elasticomyces elasticus]KAK3636012.1 hypothetical protein LTR56_014388 [Elasticomyces elasticus]KAK4916655.1 hypothetical protein LTR49_015353 [Elasticomyces elasticus]KAK5754929.1 hypothetical protein LTS12_014962 [Elasticomyces elasticus]
MDDLSRASSVYSSDSSRKPTYLDYSSSIDESSRPGSVRAARDYVESLSATPSRGAPLTPSTTSSSTRPSSRPSYMNYQSTSTLASSRPVEVTHNRTASSVTTIPADTQAITPYQHSSTLLVLVFAEVSPLLLQYIQIWLKKWSFTAIAVVGDPTYESDIKQLKMDIYGLVGKLTREVSVHTHIQEDWSGSELASTWNTITKKANSEIRGLLCSTSYGSKAGHDIMSVSEADFAQSWQGSVGRLHGAARALLPQLLKYPAGDVMFLVLDPTEQSGTSGINKVACEALLRQLQAAHELDQVTIDYADLVLIPEPEPEETSESIDDHQNGYYAHDAGFAASESPTKLWAMWQGMEGA